MTEPTQPSPPTFRLHASSSVPPTEPAPSTPDRRSTWGAQIDLAIGAFRGTYLEPQVALRYLSCHHGTDGAVADPSICSVCVHERAATAIEANRERLAAVALRHGPEQYQCAASLAAEAQLQREADEWEAATIAARARCGYRTDSDIMWEARGSQVTVAAPPACRHDLIEDRVHVGGVAHTMWVCRSCTLSVRARADLPMTIGGNLPPTSGK